MMQRLVALVGLVTLIAGAAAAQDKPAVKAAPAPMAIITLEKGGEIMLEFWPQDAPKHVENFVKLVNEKFYDGQRVHRVEPNFVVQFGDPQSRTLPLNDSSMPVTDPKMGSGGPGYTIKAEFNKRPFERGVLGMARANDPDSGGSQVYIMLGPAPFLNGKYTAFGKVATGMGVVDQIKVGDRIKSIRIVTK